MCKDSAWFLERGLQQVSQQLFTKGTGLNTDEFDARHNVPSRVTDNGVVEGSVLRAAVYFFRVRQAMCFLCHDFVRHVPSDFVFAILAGAFAMQCVSNH